MTEKQYSLIISDGKYFVGKIVTEDPAYFLYDAVEITTVLNQRGELNFIPVMIGDLKIITAPKSVYILSNDSPYYRIYIEAVSGITTISPVPPRTPLSIIK
ncbi:hypothetical protein HY041_02770 [Candidatus Roizmanbacteria bacterium]|nr:hypothetical protein [Candidatus Roizmanbacteria bacterium]